MTSWGRTWHSLGWPPIAKYECLGSRRVGSGWLPPTSALWTILRLANSRVRWKGGVCGEGGGGGEAGTGVSPNPLVLCSSGCRLFLISSTSPSPGPSALHPQVLRPDLPMAMVRINTSGAGMRGTSPHPEVGPAPQSCPSPLWPSGKTRFADSPAGATAVAWVRPRTGAGQRHTLPPT